MDWWLPEGQCGGSGEMSKGGQVHDDRWKLDFGWRAYRSV